MGVEHRSSVFPSFPQTEMGITHYLHLLSTFARQLMSGICLSIRFSCVLRHDRGRGGMFYYQTPTRLKSLVLSLSCFEEEMKRKSQLRKYHYRWYIDTLNISYVLKIFIKYIFTFYIKVYMYFIYKVYTYFLYNVYMYFIYKVYIY